jgi:UDP-glucose 4-epimerase
VRVAITGGAGFIGSHLADALVAAGARVVVLDDLSGGKRENVPPVAELDAVDLADADLDSVLARHAPEVVVHCAARASVYHSMHFPLDDYRVNQLGTFQLVQACARQGVGHFVLLSSGGAIYGNVGRPASETDLPAPANYYGVHKWAAERYVELSGVPATALRLANVYGPRQRSDSEGGVVAIFLQRIRSGQPIVLYGGGEQTRDYLYVSDVVAAIVAAIEHRLMGTWNVGSGREVRLRAILDAIVAALGRPADVRIEPRPPGDVARSCVDATRLLQTGLWRPKVSLSEGIRLTIAGT